MKRLSLLFFAIVSLVPLAATAQESVASQETTIPGGTLMLVTYFAFVAFMLGYMALLSFRQRKLDRDIGALERRLDELADIAE